MISLAETINSIRDRLEQEQDQNSDWTPARLSLATDRDQQFADWDRYKSSPKSFLTEVLGSTQSWEGEDQIMRAIVDHNQIGVHSGHALGKDYVSARLILWFLYTHMPSIVIATASSDRQVDKVIWGELEEGYHHALRPLPGRLLTKELIVDEKQRWYAMGFTTKDVNKTQGKFQGFHSQNVLIIFSEAQAIERSIWDQAESLMTAGNAKWIAIGNPLVNFGPFYEACQPGSGWFAINLDCEKSPNVIQRREVIPGLCSAEWVDRMAERHGKTSSIYRSKVKGLFPNKSTESFIDSRWVEWAVNQGSASVKPNGVLIAGVDIGGTGVDKTVITIRDGLRIIEMRKYTQEEIIIWKDGTWASEHRGLDPRSTMELADILITLFLDGVHRVYLDIGGVGTGVYDRLVQQGRKNQVVPVNFGARPLDAEDDEAQDEFSNRERYADMVTQMYARYAKLLENRQTSMPNDPDLHMQLVNRKMFARSDGKKKLESKDDYKGRGFDSPDEADSVVLCYCDVELKADIDETWVSVDEQDGGHAGLWER